MEGFRQFLADWGVTVVLSGATLTLVTEGVVKLVKLGFSRSTAAVLLSRKRLHVEEDKRVEFLTRYPHLIPIESSKAIQNEQHFFMALAALVFLLTMPKYLAGMAPWLTVLVLLVATVGIVSYAILIVVLAIQATSTNSIVRRARDRHERDLIDAEKPSIS